MPASMMIIVFGYKATPTSLHYIIAYSLGHICPLVLLPRWSLGLGALLLAASRLQRFLRRETQLTHGWYLIAFLVIQNKSTSILLYRAGIFNIPNWLPKDIKLGCIVYKLTSNTSSILLSSSTSSYMTEIQCSLLMHNYYNKLNGKLDYDIIYSCINTGRPT